jgi:(1->4)-alpha-D-glucan 1-alpha-D-glucosylmutase
LETDDDIAALASAWRDGRIKQRLLRTLLAMRAADPDFFARADYVPLAANPEDTLAFSRSYQGRQMLVGVPLHRAVVVTGLGRIDAGIESWRQRLPAPFADAADRGFATIADLPGRVLFQAE